MIKILQSLVKANLNIIHLDLLDLGSFIVFFQEQSALLYYKLNLGSSPRSNLEVQSTSKMIQDRNLSMRR